MNDDQVTMSNYDFWCLRNAHERLAVESGDVREIVLCAQVRMQHIATGITNTGRPKRLAKDDDKEHLFSALRLLEAAKETEHKIAKANRIKTT